MSNNLISATFDKAAADIALYTMDFGPLAAFARTTPPTISSAMVTPDAGITAGNFPGNVWTPGSAATISGTLVSVGLSGGTAGVTYNVLFQVTLSTGEVYDRWGALRVN